jgi:hypothetical protein
VVAPTAISQRVESRLEWLRRTLGDLPEIAAEWAELGDGERVGWSTDWAQIMASDLPELERYRRAGQLTPEQATRYRGLLRQLAAALPTVEQLGLYPPTVPLEG